jgi:DNA gyrase subunit A
MAVPPETQPVALHEATRQRYLNYALSVITARALPDVRDGLKPVQRRILYAMFINLGLRPDARYRKSAAVVGEVMAKYHPHGDSSIYEALVRMAQTFSLRHPLVDGQGNFGSLDGDSAAAMRYTECKLRPIAVELLSELRQRTVDFRPNYDGQHVEPEVLPAQFPQLLVNGSEGIAVGMATRIPPHNLREVVDAAVALIDHPDADASELARKLKGPDFPTGGIILNDPEELAEIYRTGSGGVRVRARWTTERVGRRTAVIITEIPYATNKAILVEKIGAAVEARKIPQVVDVRDESTDQVRVVLELRAPEDAGPAMAWLFKHTALQSTFPVNLTCLIPPEGDGLPAPVRADLRTLLRAWLKFRHRTVIRRFRYELEELQARIHLLEGFAKIFGALDEAIRLIRTSEGRTQAHERLMNRFDLDDEQTKAILELQLYKIARLEIAEILQELAEKQARAAEIDRILSNDAEIWMVVRTELKDIRSQYGEPRRTRIGAEDGPPVEYNEDNYIVAEDTWVFVTRDGWIKRQGSFAGAEKVRLREGDILGWVVLAETRHHITFFTDQGSAYSLKVDQIPATTGHGEPIQKHFKFADGERVVGVATSEPRGLPCRPDPETPEGPPYGVAVARSGKALRFLLAPFLEASTRAGRRFAKVDEDTDRIVGVRVVGGTEELMVATLAGRALALACTEVNLVKGPARGAALIKATAEDPVIGLFIAGAPGENPRVTTARAVVHPLVPEQLRGPKAGPGLTFGRNLGPCSASVDLERLDLRFPAGLAQGGEE